LVRNQHADPRQPRYNLLEDLQALASQVGLNGVHPRNVPLRLGEIRHQPLRLKIATTHTHGDRPLGVLRSPRHAPSPDRHDVNLELHQLGSDDRDAIQVSRSTSTLHHDVLSLHPAEFSHPPPEKLLPRKDDGTI